MLLQPALDLPVAMQWAVQKTAGTNISALAMLLLSML
jgi:hypothetical protein